MVTTEALKLRQPGYAGRRLWRGYRPLFQTPAEAAKKP
jgi:hypothetical protein